MSDLDLQIFTREATSGKEQESSAGWVEQSAKNDGSYNTDIALWAPEFGEPDEGGFFDFNTTPRGGIRISSNCQAEVFSGEEELIIRDEPRATAAVTIKNDRACAKVGQAEIFFHYGAILGLTIKMKGQPVKEVRIVGEVSE